jgi:hypothetical protein
MIVDGSVIFCIDGFLVKPIYKHTGSKIVHVALVLDGFAFEATWPCVKKTPLDDYYKQLERHRIKYPNYHWLTSQPTIPYTSDELAHIRRYAKSQL